MISMGILSTNEQIITIIKNILDIFINKHKIMSNLHVCKDVFTLLSDSPCDIYILDMDYFKNIDQIIKDIKALSPNAKQVLISSEKKDAHLISDLVIDFFLLKPIEEEKLIQILEALKCDLKDLYILVPVKKGLKKIKVKDINYIDNENRCITYHMINKETIQGHSLSKSFEKETAFLLDKKPKSLYFIKPTLIINLNQINGIEKDYIIFDNQDTLYLKQCASEGVLEAWKNFTRFINLTGF